jgi:crotonobetainyl-CoA:carnitine CoA-transferase CaiB-like acyl-CoA transferase
LRETRPAARFLNATLTPARYAPSIGEHTDIILKELGLLGALGEMSKPIADKKI